MSQLCPADGVCIEASSVDLAGDLGWWILVMPINCGFFMCVYVCIYFFFSGSRTEINFQLSNWYFSPSS